MLYAPSKLTPLGTFNRSVDDYLPRAYRFKILKTSFEFNFAIP